MRLFLRKDILISKNLRTKLFVQRYCFSVWFSMSSGVVSLFNSLGTHYDDKNLLLYITSPPLWQLENYSSLLRSFLGHNLLVLYRIVNILFWLLVGLLIDWRISKSNEGKYFEKISLSNPIIILLIAFSFLLSLVGIIGVIIGLLQVKFD